MRLRSARRAQAEIIATLIMVAASALLTTIMLFWGIGLQGQSNSNFGTALARTNAQAAEQISIDNVLFTVVSSGCSGPVANHCFSATVYARNFGSSPIQLAGVQATVLASGVSPAGDHCEVIPSSGSTVHAVIVARAMIPVDLNSVTFPGCTASTKAVFSSTWNGQTISIQISTAAGTIYSANFAVPP